MMTLLSYFSPIPKRYKIYVYLTLLCFVSYIYFSYSNLTSSSTTIVISAIPEDDKIVNLTMVAGIYEKNVSEEFLIDTGFCSISKTQIMPFKGWHYDNAPNCSYESVISELEDETQVLMLGPEYVDKSCFVQEIEAVPKNDKLYKLGSCEAITNQMSVADKEMIVTQCGINLNFGANFKNTNSVRRKLEFWKNFKGMKPYSVLLIGIDTFSRSHAYRSLPKTLEFMKSEMDFIDFKGYHSVAAGTIQNFIGFLTGKQMSEVERTCQRHWFDPFDPCPFIWRNFSKSNYVTMYVEDGDQSFNWGEKYGFSERPTDYYIHPLFLALKDLRGNISAPLVGKKYNHLRHGGCTSSETVPQFLLRYTERFTKKFLDVPSFSFTWLAYPFHAHHFPPKYIVDSMSEFFRSLKAVPQLMQDTMIVFVSDHGVRERSDVLDGFLERGLPPLFIRLPDRLDVDFPGNKFREILRMNSERLTSPFDIHHTFLHLLSLSSTLSPNFDQVMPDRTSLILPVPLNRTCETIHVYLVNCVCNVSIKVNSVQNPFLLERIREFLELELNKIVGTPEYKHICAKWTLNIYRWLKRAQILKTMTNQLEVLIQFEAEPRPSHYVVKVQFEALVRIHHAPTEKEYYGKSHLLGNFTRISLYRAQSNCIGNRTSLDKEMKGLCYCRSQLKKKNGKT